MYFIHNFSTAYDIYMACSFSSGFGENYNFYFWKIVKCQNKESSSNISTWQNTTVHPIILLNTWHSSKLSHLFYIFPALKLMKQWAIIFTLILKCTNNLYVLGNGITHTQTWLLEMKRHTVIKLASLSVYTVYYI